MALEWSGKAQFNAAGDHKWMVAGKQAGLARSAGGFTFLQVVDCAVLPPLACTSRDRYHLCSRANVCIVPGVRCTMLGTWFPWTSHTTRWRWCATSWKTSPSTSSRLFLFTISVKASKASGSTSGRL